MATGLISQLQNRQPSPSEQTRIQLARSLMSQGTSGAPVQSVTQGLNRLAQGFLGGRLANIQSQEEQRRQEALAQTLRNVTQAGQQGLVTGPGGGGTGEVATSRQRMVDILSSNPQTAPMAAQIQLSQALQGPQAQTQTVPGTVANRLLGVDRFGANDAVTLERSPQGTVVKDVFETEAPSGNAVNIKLPGRDEPVSGIEDDQGRLFIRNEQGERVRAPRDAVKVGIRGTPEEAGVDQTQERNLDELETNTRMFLSTANDVFQLLEDKPNANTWTAGAARLINNFQQEAKAFAENTGLEVEPGALDPENYSSEFDQLGIENARMKSLFTALAFQAAAASGQTGRSVSDRDVRRFFQEVGAQESDPRAIQRVLRDVAERSVRRYQFAFESARGEPPDVQFRLPGEEREQGGNAVDLGDGVTLEFQ